MSEVNLNLYEQLSAERKQLQREGRIPSWYLTGSWQLFKSKYLYQATDVRTQFQRIAKAAAAHLIDVGVDTVQLAEKKFFDLMWRGHLSLSTPVLSNMGSDRALPVSCQGTLFGDSIDNFYSRRHELAMHTKYGFGTSGFLGNVRPRGTPIHGGGKAEGILPLFDGIVKDMQYVSQGSTRRGSFGGYVPFSHGDFDELVDYCQATPDDVNIGWVVTDQDVRDLVDQKPEATRRFKRAMRLKMITGRGYFFFVDKANRHAPEALKASGRKINASNLCFTGDTLVAVADGRNAVSMKELYDEGETFQVYSARQSKRVIRGIRSRPGASIYGSEWTSTINEARVVMTGRRKMVRVHLENGDYFDCTPDHRLATTTYGEWVEAAESKGVELEPFFTTQREAKYRCINSVSSNTQHVAIWEHFNGQRPAGYHVDHIDNEGTDGIENLRLLSAKKHFQRNSRYQRGDQNTVFRQDPQHRDSISKVAFLERNGNFCGLSDQDLIRIAKSNLKGRKEFTYRELMDCVYQNGGPCTLSKNRFQQFQAAGYERRHHWFAAIVRGESEYIDPVDYTEELSFVGDTREVPDHPHLVDDGHGGLEFRGTKVSRIETLGVRDCYDVQVIDDDGELDDNEHNFYIVTSGKDDKYLTSRGVLVHNCTEIMLPSDDDYTFVCVLSSANLLHWDRIKDSDDIFWMTVFLDCVNSNFIRRARKLPGMERSVRFAEDFAAVGLGVCGWHTLLQSKMIPFESLEAHMLNQEIFEHLDRESRRASAWLYDKRGPVKWTKGTGMRNATRLAVAPTKSSALIMGGVSESTGPDPAMTFTQASAGGEMLRVNQFILPLMRERGVYSKQVFDDLNSMKGSVQHVDWLSPEEKLVFRTAFEINMEAVLRLAAARTKYIDQGQSLNLYFSANEDPRWISHIHHQAFTDEKILSLYYVYSQRGISAASRECIACQ